MKITSKQLRRLIKEESHRALRELWGKNLPPTAEEWNEGFDIPQWLINLFAELAIGFTPAAPAVDAEYMRQALLNWDNPDTSLAAKIADIGLSGAGVFLGVSELRALVRAGNAVGATPFTVNAGKRASAKLDEISEELADEVTEKIAAVRVTRTISATLQAQRRRAVTDLDNLTLPLAGYLRVSQQQLISATGPKFKVAFDTLRATTDPVKLKGALDTIGKTLREGRLGYMINGGSTSRSIRELGNQFIALSKSIAD